MARSNTEYFLESLKPGDRVTGLSIGDARFLPLKTFFQKDSKRFEASSLARTYVMRAAGSPEILAYMTMVCGEIEIENGAEMFGGGRYPYKGYPAVKIVRLLVDAKQRGKDIGRALIEFALGTVKDVICPVVGCRFIVVDAKADSVGFYKKCGFTLLDTPLNQARSEPVMFIDLLRTTN